MRLSALLLGALEELDKFEATENARVYMGSWVKQVEGGPCFACLGGIWALKKAGVTDFLDHTVVRDAYKSIDDEQIMNQELALDELRTGHVSDAYETLTNNYSEQAERLNRTVTCYHEDAQKFKTEMRQLAADLKGSGL